MGLTDLVTCAGLFGAVVMSGLGIGVKVEVDGLEC